MTKLLQKEVRRMEDPVKVINFKFLTTILASRNDFEIVNDISAMNLPSTTKGKFQFPKRCSSTNNNNNIANNTCQLVTSLKIG